MTLGSGRWHWCKSFVLQEYCIMRLVVGARIWRTTFGALKAIFGHYVEALFIHAHLAFEFMWTISYFCNFQIILGLLDRGPIHKIFHKFWDPRTLMLLWWLICCCFFINCLVITKIILIEQHPATYICGYELLLLQVRHIGMH
jgi:hypothetical protein